MRVDNLELLLLSGAARLKGCNVKTVKYNILKGHLRGRKIQGLWFVVIDDPKDARARTMWDGWRPLDMQNEADKIEVGRRAALKRWGV